MGLEYSIGLMGQFMKEIGNTIKEMDMVARSLWTVIYMKDFDITIKVMDMDNILVIIQKQFMKESGIMIKKADKVKRYGLIKRYIKGSLNTERKMVKEWWLFMQIKSMKETLSMIELKVLGALNGVMAKNI